MNKQIPPAAHARVGDWMPSAEGAGARPDAFAVSPATGPAAGHLRPAVTEPDPPPDLLWHRTVPAGGWVECCRGGS
jgi:hypothetical protein